MIIDPLVQDFMDMCGYTQSEAEAAANNVYLYDQI